MSSSTFETHRSFVNTWECDENDHMNVQFYFKRFEEAADVMAVRCGFKPYNRQLVTRHVRYHKELRSAECTLITSGIVARGTAETKIAHLMISTTTGELAATALDTVKMTCDGLEPADAEFVSPAMPRGVEDHPSDPFDSAPLLADGKATLSNHSVVRNCDLDENGLLLSSRIVSRFTDGAPHIWDHFGITAEWLTQSRKGRVAVEMKLTPRAKTRPGDVLRQVSFVPEIAGKTFLIRHQLENAATGDVIALGDVRALVMDLITRRAIPLPELAGRIDL